MIDQAVILAGAGAGAPLGAEPPAPWLTGELRRHGVADVLVLAGAGPALRAARGRLAERFFLLDGDSLFDINLWDLALAAQGFPAFLALRPAEAGGVALDGAAVTAFGPLGSAGMAYGGVGVLDRAVLDGLPEGASSLEASLYPALAARGQLGGRLYRRPFAAAGAIVTRTRGAVIFDRDGVLNEDSGFAHRPDQIVWVKGAMAAVKAVNDAGLLAFVATNQSGVARGLYAEDDVRALHLWMNRQLMAAGAHIDAFAYSPYHPQAAVEAYRRDSGTRKPGPDMLLDLMAAYPVDRARVLMIGDSPRDVQAAEAAKVQGMLFEGGDLAAVLEPVIRRLA